MKLVCAGLFFWQGAASAAEIPQLQGNTPDTIFGGVGRMYQTWYAGIDFLLLSTPHTNAHRTVGLISQSFWIEWWPDDRYGVKGFASPQKFQSFGSDSIDISTQHLGAMAIIRFPIDQQWQLSAGMGLAQTAAKTPDGSKSGTSLATEFRMGVKILPDLQLEMGMLSLDGSSGSAPGDIRLGSTSYMFGFSKGF